MSIYHQIQADEAFARLDAFHHIIDVRTPLEYAEDHLPGALNWPVLSNEERVIVGTLYRQDPLEARKVGAALVGGVGRHRIPSCPVRGHHGPAFQNKAAVSG